MADRFQSVIIDGHRSSKFPLNTGVPQGSIAGPCAFTTYISPLYSDIQLEGTLDGYADDNQHLYAFDPKSTGINEVAITVEQDIGQVRSWMLQNYLKINDSKTEIIVIGSKYNLRDIEFPDINVGGSLVKPVTSVRDLGVIIDENFNMETHVNQLCNRAYAQFFQLKRIRTYVDNDNLQTIIHAFITSKLDYCNSVLYGLPEYQINKLQKVQNCCARLVFNASYYSSASELLKRLHWLPIKFRIIYKVCLIVHKTLKYKEPVYLAEMLIPYDSGRRLRSSNKNLLKVPMVKTNNGKRMFQYCGPYEWNKLPQNIRDCESTETFKKLLKTHFFKQAFNC